jgi:hypothetical protein
MREALPAAITMVRNNHIALINEPCPSLRVFADMILFSSSKVNQQGCCCLLHGTSIFSRILELALSFTGAIYMYQLEHICFDWEISTGDQN